MAKGTKKKGAAKAAPAAAPAAPPAAKKGSSPEKAKSAKAGKAKAKKAPEEEAALPEPVIGKPVMDRAPIGRPVVGKAVDQPQPATPADERKASVRPAGVRPLPLEAAGVTGGSFSAPPPGPSDLPPAPPPAAAAAPAPAPTPPPPPVAPPAPAQPVPSDPPPAPPPAAVEPPSPEPEMIEPAADGSYTLTFAPPPDANAIQQTAIQQYLRARAQQQAPPAQSKKAAMKALTVPDPALSPPTKRKPKAKEEAGPSADPAWTGEGEAQMDFTVGEVVFMLNPYFRDGTRLRLDPCEGVGLYWAAHPQRRGVRDPRALDRDRLRKGAGSQRPDGMGRRLRAAREARGMGARAEPRPHEAPIRPRLGIVDSGSRPPRFVRDVDKAHGEPNNVVRVAAGLLLEVSRQTGRPSHAVLRRLVNASSSVGPVWILFVLAAASVQQTRREGRR